MATLHLLSVLLGYRTAQLRQMTDMGYSASGLVGTMSP